MRGVLQELNLRESMLLSSQENGDPPPPNKDRGGWKLFPMLGGDLQGTDLGGKLEDALLRARKLTPQGGVVFLGMDAPILILDDIVRGLCDAHAPILRSGGWTGGSDVTAEVKAVPSALLCPADDGGYGMLCVPPNADPLRTFRGMYWSHQLTAIAQVKALTDQNIMVKIGKMMNDIDEPSDVEALCKRLLVEEHHEDDEGGTNLSFHCGGSRNGFITSQHPSCQYTRKALQAAGLL
jgi:glycosyltransferase A (GT-A) superfamily protein (DUF2064 family)